MVPAYIWTYETYVIYYTSIWRFLRLNRLLRIFCVYVQDNSLLSFVTWYNFSVGNSHLHVSFHEQNILYKLNYHTGQKCFTRTQNHVMINYTFKHNG